jgi:hypothetical protein
MCCQQALEAALPESADNLMSLIMRHTAAGPPARFAAAQLLTIAAKCTVGWPQYQSTGTKAVNVISLMRVHYAWTLAETGIVATVCCRL